MPSTRYFLTLSFDGTAYHGWQMQPGDVTVQECLQKALSTLLRCDTPVTGAGRTDAGVHARKMVAHFDICTDGNASLSACGIMTPDGIDCRQLVYKLNKLLPPDIAVQDCKPVPQEMHARFSATSRTYHYYVHMSKDPFLRHHSCQLHIPLDFEAMNSAAKVLMQYTDFTSFSKLHTQVKTNNCRIMKAEWEHVGEGQWRFVIQADRFLRNMVRAIVGTLFMVGKAQIDEAGLRRIIEQKDRCRAGDSVPAHALYLVDIQYPG